MALAGGLPPACWRPAGAGWRLLAASWRPAGGLLAVLLAVLLAAPGGLLAIYPNIKYVYNTYICVSLYNLPYGIGYQSFVVVVSCVCACFGVWFPLPFLFLCVCTYICWLYIRILIIYIYPNIHYNLVCCCVLRVFHICALSSDPHVF